MTEEEIIAKQKKMFQDIIEKDIPLQRAVRDTLQKQVTRIFIDGKNSAGGNIGQYDTTRSLYVNPDLAPSKFKPQGKNEDKPLTTKVQRKNKKGKVVTSRVSIKSDFTERKTKFFPHYKAFREEVNRPTDKVNLDLTSDLRFDFSNSTGSVNPVQVNTHEYQVGFKRPHNAKKAEGHEDKYGKVYHNTDAEVQNFFTVSAKEFKLITSA